MLLRFRRYLSCASDFPKFRRSLCLSAEFSGEQLTGLKEDTLVDNDMFTDYTNEDGEWRTVKDNGKDITLTVWTRY